MIWNRDPDRWTAFGLTCLLMMIWIWTPLGGWVAEVFQLSGGFLARTLGGDAGRDAEGICVGLGLFSWPITGIIFFWTVRIALRRRRLRNVAKSFPDQPVAPHP